MNLQTFADLCKNGQATAQDAARIHAEIDRLFDANNSIKAQVKRQSRFKQTVDNYRAAMAPRFGLEIGLPSGDKL